MSATTTSGPGRGPAYQQALVGLRAAQKPGQGVPAYTRWINRPAHDLMGANPRATSAPAKSSHHALIARPPARRAALAGSISMGPGPEIERPIEQVSYIRATLKGMALTFRHMVNPRKVTLEYPDQKPELSARWRGTTSTG